MLLWDLQLTLQAGNADFTLITISCVLAVVVFGFTWNVRGQEVVKG